MQEPLAAYYLTLIKNITVRAINVVFQCFLNSIVFNAELKSKFICFLSELIIKKMSKIQIQDSNLKWNTLLYCMKVTKIFV